MEIVFTKDCPEIFSENKINGFYGDVVDLLKMGYDIDGIIYDDRWTVKKLLNRMSFKNAKRIDSIFNYLDLDMSLLSKKVYDLSQRDFKFILLAKALIENRNNIIFDFFDVGLTYKDKKKVVKIMRTLKHDGKTIIVISKDLVFMNQIVDSIHVVNEGEIVYNGQLNELFKSDLVEEPDIIKFIKLANKKNAKLDYTLDSKELLKDIYRSVY